jgi:hypothetical protein
VTDVPKITTKGMPPRVVPDVRVRGCTIGGCEAPHFARGLCRPHYRRAYYRANAARAIELNRQWRARKRMEPEVSQHHVESTDVDVSSDGSPFRSDGAVAPAPAGRRRANRGQSETPRRQREKG